MRNKKNSFRFFEEKGQSIWEVVVVLFLLSLILVGLIRATIYSVSNVNFAKNQNLARDLGQAKISGIVNYAKSYPDFFWRLQDGGMYYVGLLGRYELDDEGKVCYEINITSEASDLAKVEVSVFWDQGTTRYSCGGFSYRNKTDLVSKVFRGVR